MGRSGLLLYEQAYNDLTEAVKRAKQVCRKRKPKIKNAATASVLASVTVDPMNPVKPQRGRPKGSKDTLPRKVRANANSLTQNSVSFMSKYTDHTPQCQIYYQPNGETAAHIGPCADEPCVPVNNDVAGQYSQISMLSDSPIEIVERPSCWDLPIPC